jgi:hypothetical protein
LESDKVICQNCDSPRLSEEKVSDGAHKLVFVMHSGDAQEVSTSDVVLDCTSAEGLDVIMEQLAQEVCAGDTVFDCGTLVALDAAMEQLAQAAVEQQLQMVTRSSCRFLMSAQ